jgi:hypothetical protein
LGEIGFYERRETPRKHPMYPLEKVAEARITSGKHNLFDAAVFDRQEKIGQVS